MTTKREWIENIVRDVIRQEAVDRPMIGWCKRCFAGSVQLLQYSDPCCIKCGTPHTVEITPTERRVREPK